ncbi:MAG: TonB-dependent receptor [Caulobacterales bacterium]|nr:TonB-dependent receptor [Caulobacterales bacterium]
MAARAADPDAAQLAEIVVTAQKREERLQEVPLSVVVVPAQTLQAFRMNQVSDLQHLAPGLTLSNAAGPRSFGFFVRGIGTSSFSSESIEGSTAFVVDGVVLGQSGASLTDLPDVDRVEVLRGPQGTLFGKNASAGVISVTTRRPSDTFHAEASGSWASPDNEWRASGLVTGPLGDHARGLISARINRRDGYIDNVFDHRRLNDQDDWGVRGKLELDPSQDLQVTLIGDYWKRTADCCIWTLERVALPPSAVELAQLAAGITPGPDNLKQDVDGDVFSNSESYGVSAQADYQLGGYTVTSITAWRRFLTTDGLDSDSTPLNLLDVNFADFSQRQFTQELRLTSPKGGFVDYVAGAFYFDGKVHSASVQLFPSVPLPFASKLVVNEARTKNLALFGQANLNFTSQFRGIVGGRVLRERAEAEKDRRDPRFGLTSTANADKTDHALVWRLGAQYDVTHDVMAFATVTRGYKGGGYDTNITIAGLPDVKPEKPTNLEVGLRTSWPDQRLVLNLTAFHTKVKGYQAGARDPGPPPFTRIFNGEGLTKGVEMDSAWKPLAGADWTLTASGAYVDARWGSFANAPCFPGQTAAQGCVGAQQDLTHAPLPLTPKWSGSLTSHYERAVGEGLRASLDLGANLRSSELMAFPNDPSTRRSGYTLINASVGVGPESRAWRVSVFGRNLTDKRYSLIDFSTPFGGASGSYSQFIPAEAQRRVGVALDLRY